jgi:N-acetylmuramoyl-L-alanine amidase
LPGQLFAAKAPRESKAYRVVIDPGHGGTDLGTVYDSGRVKIAEKQVTLLLAEEAARQLRARGIQVVLTRHSDQEVPLALRTALANKVSADLFLSIHLNSTAHRGNAEAEGIETYILNNTSDASSRRLARLENSMVRTGATDAPESSDVALILKDLRLDANLSESKRFACSIQRNMGAKKSPLKDRGVKQALFYVPSRAPWNSTGDPRTRQWPWLS